VLTDRIRRVALLAGSLVLWTVAMVASGLAQSFVMLLIIRAGLGAVTVTTGPTLTSLVGDLFPGWERARVYGWILSGELIGAAFGFLIAGEVASAVSWQGAFFVLAVPSLALAAALFRLPEPARGGASRLSWGARKVVSAEAAPRDRPRDQHSDGKANLVQREVRKRHVEPDQALVLRQDPLRMSLWTATKYILRIRTNLVLIVTSALGYFYFQNVQTFGLVFLQRGYRLSHATATLLVIALGIGALLGVQAGGRLADRLMRKGRINGRIIVGASSYVVAAICFLPALAAHTLLIGLPFYVLAAFAFAARNPPLDAARLDIMHSRLWGRAEAVRTLFRRCAVAVAPVSFGLLADALSGGHGGAGAGAGYATAADAHGLEYAFLLLLVTLAAGGALTFRALRTYPRDVATAEASEANTRQGQDNSGRPHRRPHARPATSHPLAG
jgi:MFS family permease